MAGSKQAQGGQNAQLHPALLAEERRKEQGRAGGGHHRFGTHEGGALRVNHDLTQEEIAQLVGASRETVNKALATFAHRGWIRLEGKSVLIVDTEHLARRAR